MKTMIDPPSGWRYGFPRVYNPEPEETMGEFLKRHGLPAELIELSEKFGCRFWEEPDE